MKREVFFAFVAMMMAAMLGGVYGCSNDSDELENKSGNGMDGSTLQLNLSAPGSLATYIGDSIMYKITSLKVTGELNSTDIWFIRQMAGCDENGNSTKGILAYLDLSEAKIVAGGRPYLIHTWSHGGTSIYYTCNDKLSNRMFYGCVSLVSISLPQVTEVNFDYESDSDSGACFEGCTGLQTMIIPRTVSSIKFSSPYLIGIRNILKLIFLNPTPPGVSYHLGNYNFNNLSIYVPKGSLKAYRQILVFNNFEIIESD